MGDIGEIVCPHCHHAWYLHAITGERCTSCGCMWRPPTPDAPAVKPPTEREQLIALVAATIWAELEAQDIYVDSDMGTIDSSGEDVDMVAVAAAVVVAFEKWGSE